MSLNSHEAARLVTLVEQAEDLDSALTAAGAAFSFLVAQLHVLGNAAKGYPRNPIDGAVWVEGTALTCACDRFADAVARWRQHRGEEQATRLAVSMAMQVVAHYPEEIFPRVLRNARCCESLGMTDDATRGYGCIIADFAELQLDEMLEFSEPLELADVAILSSVRDALGALKRVSPQGLTGDQLNLFESVSAVLAGPRAPAPG